MKYKALLAPASEHYDAPKRQKPLAEGNAEETQWKLFSAQAQPPGSLLCLRAHMSTPSLPLRHGQGPQPLSGCAQPPSLPSTPGVTGAPAPRWLRVPPLPPARPPARPCSALSTACGRRSLGCTGTATVRGRCRVQFSSNKPLNSRMRSAAVGVHACMPVATSDGPILPGDCEPYAFRRDP